MIRTIVLIAVGIHVKYFRGCFIPTLLYFTHPFGKKSAGFKTIGRHVENIKFLLALLQGKSNSQITLPTGENWTFNLPIS
jgi:hypothetical protein